MDGIVFFPLCILVVWGIGLHVYHSGVRFYNRLFKEVAQKLNLEFTKGIAWKLPKISGNIEPFPIEVRIKPVSGKFPLKIKIIGAMELPVDIRISKESTLTKMQEKIGIGDIEIGDEQFDRLILFQTAFPKTLIACMDMKTRRAISDLADFAEDFLLTQSELSVTHEGKPNVDAQAIVRLIRLMTLVVRQVSGKMSLEDRYSQNILFDPIPQVRINNVRALMDNSLVNFSKENVLEQALENSSIELQIEAAKHLKEKGITHLLQVLEIRGNSLTLETINSIIDTLSQGNCTECIPLLVGLYGTAREDMFKKALLRAFSIFSDGSVHSFLMTELEKENPVLQEEIIDALGACGEVEGVEKLILLGKKTVNPFTKKRINEAISRIQSRLGKVEKGWVSVSQTQDTDGALSMHNSAEEGALSLTGQDSKTKK